ncbi:2TM domain-containing protein [Hymenobacter psychrotolerans]|nr:2TM domain-containing protein [Hymenobacter psychrotolerans]
MAKDRAKFKSHLFTYLTVNALLWTIWALTGRPAHPIPWPVWASAFWGFGVLMNGIGVYGGFGRAQLSEREYERLLRQQREGRV